MVDCVPLKHVKTIRELQDTNSAATTQISIFSSDFQVFPPNSSSKSKGVSGASGESWSAAIKQPGDICIHKPWFPIHVTQNRIYHPESGGRLQVDKSVRGQIYESLLCSKQNQSVRFQSKKNIARSTKSISNSPSVSIYTFHRGTQHGLILIPCRQGHGSDSRLSLGCSISTRSDKLPYNSVIFNSPPTGNRMSFLPTVLPFVAIYSQVERPWQKNKQLATHPSAQAASQPSNGLLALQTLALSPRHFDTYWGRLVRPARMTQQNLSENGQMDADDQWHWKLRWQSFACKWEKQDSCIKWPNSCYFCPFGEGQVTSSIETISWCPTWCHGEVLTTHCNGCSNN